MTTFARLLLVLALCCFPLHLVSQGGHLTGKPVSNSKRIQKILKGLSLKEKVGQMTQLDINMFIIPGTDEVDWTKLEGQLKRACRKDKRFQSMFQSDCATVAKRSQNCRKADRAAVAYQF
jgi:hypothetical protein